MTHCILSAIDLRSSQECPRWDWEVPGRKGDLFYTDRWRDRRQRLDPSLCACIVFTWPCCGMLHCNAMQCTALHCTILHCTALHSVSHHIISHHITSHHITSHHIYWVMSLYAIDSLIISSQAKIFTPNNLTWHVTCETIERHGLVEQFQTRPRIRVALLSITAAGIC